MGSLPGIKSVGWIYSRDLPKDTAFRAVAGLPVPLSAMNNVQENVISLTGDAAWEADTDTEGNAEAQTVKLSFSTTDILPVGESLSFIVVDVEDNMWLIGGWDEPGVRLSRHNVSGSPDGEKKVTGYEALFTAPVALRKCYRSRV